MGSVQIKSGQLVDSAIIAVKIATGAVESDKIASGAITSAKIGAAAVGESAIASGAVTSTKLGSGAVDSSAIASGAVTSAKLASAAVDEVAIASGAVTSTKLGAGAVDSTAIASGAVTTAKLASGAVDSAALAASAVTAAKMDLTGTFDFSSGVLQVGTPSNSSDAANKSYVDSVAAGLSIKENVRVAAPGNVDISSAPASIDGVTLSADDRVLLFNQTDKKQNGVYEFAGSGSAMSRTADMDASADFPGAFLFALEGNTYDNQGFVCINDAPPSLGVDNIEFQRFSGLGSVTASGGLTISGDDISIADGGVSTAKLADASVTNAKMANGAVDTAQLVNLAVTQAKIANSAVGSTQLADSSVSTAKIADAAVTSAKIGSGAVDTAALASAAVTNAKIGSAAVDTAQIADLAVTSGKIANGAVDTTQLADLAVTSGKIANSAVGSTQIANAAVSSAKIASGAVGTTALADGGVTAAKLASSSVTAVKLGITFAQEGAQISGSSTTTIDLAQTLPSNSINSVLVFKNGLNLRNMTALGDTPADNDEYSVSANGGAAGVARLTFGAALTDADALIIWYWY
jgi:trimeric autotransporter adhesin